MAAYRKSAMMGRGDADPAQPDDAISKDSIVVALGSRGEYHPRYWQDQEPHSVPAKKHRKMVPAHGSVIWISGHLKDDCQREEAEDYEKQLH
jgi:hypothetical protein